MSHLQFPVLRARLEAELKNIMLLTEDLQVRGFLQDTPKRKEALQDTFALRAVGSVLHDLYTAIENMFKIVARYIDDSVPDQADWHLELLQQVAIPVTGIRPAFITAKTKDQVNELRGFRHIFRNIYGFNLASDRIEQLLNGTEEMTLSIKMDTKQFIQYFEQGSH